MKEYTFKSVFPREMADWLNAEFKNQYEWNRDKIVRQDRASKVIYNSPWWIIEIQWMNPCFKLTDKLSDKRKGRWIPLTAHLEIWIKTGKLVIKS